MKLFDVYPINDIQITHAKGSRVWDENQNEYLDLYGGHAVISIGHTHPHWVQRIESQLKKIAFYSNSIKIPIQEELADKLGQVTTYDTGLNLQRTLPALDVARQHQAQARDRHGRHAL